MPHHRILSLDPSISSNQAACDPFSVNDAATTALGKASVAHILEKDRNCSPDQRDIIDVWAAESTCRVSSGPTSLQQTQHAATCNISKHGSVRRDSRLGFSCDPTRSCAKPSRNCDCPNIRDYREGGTGRRRGRAFFRYQVRLVDWFKIPYSRLLSGGSGDIKLEVFYSGPTLLGNARHLSLPCSSPFASSNSPFKRPSSLASRFPRRPPTARWRDTMSRHLITSHRSPT